MERKVRTQSFVLSVSPLVSKSEWEFMKNFWQLVATLAPFAFAKDVYEKAMIDDIKQLSDASSLTGGSFDPELEGRIRRCFLRDTFYRTSDPRDSVFALH
jgi:hypothetical protein